MDFINNIQISKASRFLVVYIYLSDFRAYIISFNISHNIFFLLHCPYNTKQYCVLLLDFLSNIQIFRFAKLQLSTVLQDTFYLICNLVELIV